jgi:hypothetical protein
MLTLRRKLLSLVPLAPLLLLPSPATHQNH